MKFKVTGHCLVPHEVSMEVEADTAADAERIAERPGWHQHIVSNSGDESSAFDFQAHAEEIK